MTNQPNDLKQGIDTLLAKDRATKHTLHANIELVILEEGNLDSLTPLADAILQLFTDRLKLVQIKPFDFVEPCEPDYSKESHAYHQGQWDMATRMESECSAIISKAMEEA